MEAKFKKIINPADACFLVKIDEIPAPPANLWHYHPEFELVFILEGKGTRFIGDNIEAINTGEIILMGPNLPHAMLRDKYYYESNTNLTPRMMVLQFEKDFLGADIWSKTEFIPVADLLNKAKRGLKFYGRSADNAAFMLRRINEQKGIKKIMLLLCLLEELACQQEYTYISSCGFVEQYDETDDKINKLYEFTINHFREDISLEKIASLVYLSPSAFCRYFKSKTSKTYKQFLTEVRIGYACKLLLQEKLNVSEICYECGYRNLSNFNRHFKDVTQTTPSEYYRHFQRSLLVEEEYAA